MTSEQSDDDIFLDSTISKTDPFFFPSSPKSVTTKRNHEASHDTISPLIRQIKSASLSIGENGENERTIHNRRRPSVLDEKALREADTETVREQRIDAISRSYQGILQSIGEDPSRQGLLKTAKRAAEVCINC
ncbi:unnamed protein product [Rotaria socialis]|uniref:Uncharacterized protein n=1 Tax=Rotaria socialis TaxID=392032 RepID=A0A822AVN3_9BILA|nr:unnamed protein product [Rotaria socialis]